MSISRSLGSWNIGHANVRVADAVRSGAAIGRPVACMNLHVRLVR